MMWARNDYWRGRKVAKPQTFSQMMRASSLSWVKPIRDLRSGLSWLCYEGSGPKKIIDYLALCVRPRLSIIMLCIYFLRIHKNRGSIMLFRRVLKNYNMLDTFGTILLETFFRFRLFYVARWAKKRVLLHSTIYRWVLWLAEKERYGLTRGNEQTN